jgi:spermidine synthase
MLYRNRVQLATSDALYSDGTEYLPAIMVLKAVKVPISDIRSVLVLGTGLGSIVQIIEARGGKPEYTLVEKDDVVLNWAMELFDPRTSTRVTPVCVDARAFMQQNKKQFDLIFIDVFSGRVVPEFVYSTEFLECCRNSTSVNGYVAMNFIINNDVEWEKAQHSFNKVFQVVTVVRKHINRVFVAQCT